MTSTVYMPYGPKVSSFTTPFAHHEPGLLAKHFHASSKGAGMAGSLTSLKSHVNKLHLPHPLPDPGLLRDVNKRRQTAWCQAKPNFTLLLIGNLPFPSPVPPTLRRSRDVNKVPDSLALG